jgi:REP element-mobilizing transposase RayT
MPRKARLNSPGTVAHLMGRSVPGVDLFRHDNDRRFFLQSTEEYLKQVGFRCYAFALMNTHYHFLVRTSDQELWRLMKPLNTTYAQYHKNVYGRDGPLFRDRYKSILTQDQDYLQELVRYVHLNPVRAGVCRNVRALENYPWSGHSALMGKVARSFMDTGAVLKRFGPSPVRAREAYAAFLKEGLSTDDSKDDTLSRLIRASNEGRQKGHHPDSWVIGDSTFVNHVLTSAEAKRLRVRRFEAEGRSLQWITEKVCTDLGVDVSSLATRQRGGTLGKARKVLAYVAVRQYDVPSRLVAEYCGVGTAAVSAMVRAGREILRSTK